MTARDLVTAALRLLGVVAQGEAPEASAADDARKALNTLLGDWTLEGLTSIPTVDTLNQVLYLPTGWETALRFGLAVVLAPEYGIEPPLAVRVEALEAKARLLRGIAPFTDDLRVDPALLRFSR